MDKNKRHSNTVTSLFKGTFSKNNIIVVTENKNKGTHYNNICYMFPYLARLETKKQLVINPGYLKIKGIGKRKDISFSEYIGNKRTRQDYSSDINIHVKNPEILNISNLKVTAIKSGSTVLTIKKNGLSDSIRIDVEK